MKTEEEINQIGIEYGKQKSRNRFGITDKERSEAELDFIRGYNACQQDFAIQQSDRREELKRFNGFMCSNQYDGLIPLIDTCIDDYLKSHPEPAKVEQQIKE